MSKGKRLFFLDSARGLAILLVVLGHIWETEELIPVLIYSFHVPMFFMISGVLLAHTEADRRSWSRILSSRIRGLLIPYVSYELIFTLVFGLRSRFDFSSLQANAWDGLLLNPLNVPLWFLISLFFAELALILLKKITHKAWIPMLSCLALYLIPFFAGSDCYAEELFLKTCSSLGFLAFGYFSASMICEKDLPVPVLIPALAVGLAAAWYNGKTGINKLTFHNPALFTFCGLEVSFCLLQLLKKIRLPLLELIGKNTLPVLGLHIIVLRILQEIIGLNTSGITGGLLALLLIFLLLSPVCFLINRYLPFLAGRTPRK